MYERSAHTHTHTLSHTQTPARTSSAPRFRLSLCAHLLRGAQACTNRLVGEARGCRDQRQLGPLSDTGDQSHSSHAAAMQQPCSSHAGIYSSHDDWATGSGRVRSTGGLRSCSTTMVSQALISSTFTVAFGSTYRLMPKPGRQLQPLTMIATHMWLPCTWCEPSVGGWLDCGMRQGLLSTPFHASKRLLFK